MARLILGTLLFAAHVAAAVASDTAGRFLGQPVAVLLADGRNLRLEQPFGYIDPKGVQWLVPTGTETDGASVPRVFWTAYPPFTGRYRAAAIVHDYYCQSQERTWQDTHDVFYHAMRTAGVDERTAKMLWAAVYYLGPRWGIGQQTRGPGAEKLKSDEEQREFLERMEAWIRRSDPTRTEIEEALVKGKIP